MKPPIAAIGRDVLVLNALPNHPEPMAAVITRVWSSHTAEIAMVNLSVFPDGLPLLCKTSVSVFPSDLAAAQHLAGMPGHSPTVAYWPTLE